MIEFNQFIFWCCHLNIPDIQLQKTTLKLPPFVAIPEVILNQSGFSCQNAEDFLLPYMNTLGLLTLETIKSAPEKVAIPAMEFWSTICDEAPKPWWMGWRNTRRDHGK